MKGKALSALFLTLVLLLSACGQGGSNSQITIYRAIAPYYRTGGELIFTEKVPITPGVGLINSAISAFNSVPDDQKLMNPLPSGARIIGYKLQNSALRLEAEGCDALEGTNLTLLRCCAVLTFCSIEGVDNVSIYSGEKELCPPLSDDDILIADTSA
jgi:hypothetical protein